MHAKQWGRQYQQGTGGQNCRQGGSAHHRRGDVSPPRRTRVLAASLGVLGVRIESLAPSRWQRRA
ncbi:hypothetical protein, partial [Mycobacterium sp. E1319]|uniref:hypothetical protein n=2 Tax=unclassified Mycobacterium TaxID=2642494 RepID=UPI001E535BAE